MGRRADRGRRDGRGGGERASAEPADFNEILAAARKEKEILIYAIVPSADTTLSQLEKAFAKRFGLDVAIKRVPLVNLRAVARYGSEASAGRFEADIVYATARELLGLKEQGYVSRFDWLRAFGKELPEIRRRTTT